MYDENSNKCKTESIFFTAGKVYIIISECKKKIEGLFSCKCIESL